MELLHHGAVTGVTGSCHELRLANNLAILVDCGLFQGENTNDTEQPIDFLHPGIQALIVTHAHIDHIGRIPYLLEAGFNRPIYCSAATAALMPIMLEDAIKIGLTREVLVIRRLLLRLKRLLRPLSYQQWTAITAIPGLAFRLIPAGHILGSAGVEVHYSPAHTESGSTGPARRIVFSGDIGCRDSPLLGDPQSPDYADILVLESTYGDRLHEGRAQRQQQLQAIVERCLRDQGTILIPAFAVGRTQELLYELEAIIAAFQQHQLSGASGMSWQDIAIVLDSPLALRVTEAYDDWQHWWDTEARRRVRQGRHPLDFTQLHIVPDHDRHQATVAYLKRTSAPCIVIAGSGMCTGGRIMNYLQALLPDARTDVLFVGYQAQGTLGRELQQQPHQVTIGNKAITVAATIHTLHGYSAHADQQGLLDYVAGMNSLPGEIRLVHGNTDAKKMLAQKLREHFSIQVTLPTA
ncbi:metallo-beta-lactamase family protein [Pseudidiomarina planktonica]|uniref:Metallo-beta-lactamase family protein n=1 Tax=Pseudidiomarina planktonica TaxID=1323738 RepID=A0A1Y6EJX4_9GAMM|nr:MBL fold metallo-hydrolase [Pseudidiomarina planktonica]RUO65771.1 MBL fold metallo-hydrolase [Pseudidiomarina planktonica]SMQ62907.1 metallo-beta-lactamase family protein [Pseudidiomarina planktonica]